MKSVQEQMAIIRRGAVEILVENELEQKLKKSVETGVPLKNQGWIRSHCT